MSSRDYCEIEKLDNVQVCFFFFFSCDLVRAKFFRLVDMEKSYFAGPGLTHWQGVGPIRRNP